jgi:hypothetical protein
MERAGTVLAHEVESVSGHKLRRHCRGDIIIGWLAYNVSESNGREISAKNRKFPMVKTF